MGAERGLRVWQALRRHDGDGGASGSIIRAIDMRPWLIPCAWLLALWCALQARAAEPFTVVATFSVIGDMLAHVAGKQLAIKTLVGAGGDCELYQPTAADVATVASARAVFLNDLNEEFEPWLEPLLKQARFKGAK